MFIYEGIIGSAINSDFKFDGNMIYPVACIFIAYLIGSISSSILIGKLYGIDVRNYGSGNAGASNTLRTIGKKAGVLVLLCDLLKGIIAVYIGKKIFGQTGGSLAMVFVIIGHNWPIFFGFKGGKGVATSIGAIMMMNSLVCSVILVCGIAIIAVTRYISLASVFAAVAFPILIWLTQKGMITYALVMAFIVLFRHRSNIKRLVTGKETKFGQKVDITK